MLPFAEYVFEIPIDPDISFSRAERAEKSCIMIYAHALGAIDMLDRPNLVAIFSDNVEARTSSRGALVLCSAGIAHENVPRTHPATFTFCFRVEYLYKYIHLHS